MEITTVYVITGVSRGIGLAIVKELCSRYSDIKIVACVRDPANAPLLDAVVQKYPEIIDVVKYDAGNTDNNKEIAHNVLVKYGRVDTLIPNAGIFTFNGDAADTPVDTLREHLEVNAIAPLILFQAFVPCLKASSDPKYIPISTGGASSAYIQVPIGQACYGGSKVILNFITRKIHFENEWLTSFPLAPGYIDTDMSRGSLQRLRDTTGTTAAAFEAMAMSPDEGGRMLVDIITASKRETHGGEFIDLDGSKLPW